MTNLISATALDAASYYDPTNGVEQIAMTKFSTQRSNNGTRSNKVIYETTKYFIPNQGGTYNTNITVVTNGSGMTVDVVGENDAILSDINQYDPVTTPGNPGWVRIGTKMRKFTGSLAINLANGTNWFNAAGVTIDNQIINLFVYTIYNTNTSSVQLGLARVPYFRKFGDRVASTVSELHMAIATGGTAPAATDECIQIGRLDARLFSSSGSNVWQTILAGYNIIVAPISKTSKLKANFNVTYFTRSLGSVVYDYMIEDDVCSIWTYEQFGATPSTPATGVPTFRSPFLPVGEQPRQVVYWSNPGVGNTVTLLLANNSTDAISIFNNINGLPFSANTTNLSIFHGAMIRYPIR